MENIESITVRFDKKKRIIFRTDKGEKVVVLSDFIKKSMGIVANTVSEKDINDIVAQETQKRIDGVKDSAAFGPDARQKIIMSIRSKENQRKIYNQIKNSLIYAKAKTEGTKDFESYFEAIKKSLEPFTHILKDIEPRK